MGNRRGRSLYTLAAVLTGIMGVTLLGNSLVFGQRFSAAISGGVRDATGAVVPDAAITVRQTETGLTRTAETDASGGYKLPSLPVGPYELTVEKAGFKQQVRMGITLVVGQEAVVNFTLEVGNVQQVVEVTGEAPIVNTTLASTSGLVSQQQVKDLPLNGRSFDQLLTLNVGTANNSSNLSGAGGDRTAFSVAGKRTETNRFMINGVDWIGSNQGAVYLTPHGASGQLLGVEAVREYNVLQHTYGAEYGKRAGGQISIVTSSGTNQLHGSAFEYLRNSALDGRNFFDVANAPAPTPVPPFKRNQLGGALGGPLQKDKLFLFGNYEGFRQRWALSNAAIVPDALARQGLLPCYLANTAPTACPDRGAYVSVPNLQPGMLPYANYFYPAPNGPELPQSGTGLPTGTAYNFSNPGQSVREDFGLVRLDHTVSGKDSYSANYTFDDGHNDRPSSNSNFIQLARDRSHSLGLQETHVFSPSFLNVTTLGFARAWAGQTVPPAVPMPAELAFISGSNPGSITIGGGAVTVIASAIVQANGNAFNLAVRNHYTWADEAHWVKGNHSWSAGVWFQKVQQNIWGGALSTAGTLSYPTLLGFLQDRPTQFVANPFPVPLGYRSTEAAWYIQDEIKLRPNLTLRLGLRDEMTDGWNEVKGRCANYTFDAAGVILTDPFTGHACLTENNAKALWQPRVGLAWDPTGTGTWAIRAGFGIHNDLQDNLAQRIFTNPPFNPRFTLTDPLLSFRPIQRGTQLPPNCNAQSPLQPPACLIVASGGVDPTMHTPTIQQWSFTVERGITKDLMLQASYVGMQSYHNSTTIDMNVSHPQVCADPAGCASGGTRGAAGRVPQGTTYMPPGPRLNRFVAQTLSWFFLGTAGYHAANLSLVKRSRSGVTFKTNYTFSKIMDINSAILAGSATNEPPTILNPFDLKLSRGVGSYSLQHQFNGNFSYPLPLGSGQRFGSGATGWVDKLIGGWQGNGILTAQSGFPFTPVAGSNVSGTGDTQNPDTPNRNPDFQGPVIVGKVDQWFNPNAFLLPTPGTFGNVARGSLIGPRLITFDTSLFKKFSINEKWGLQFRAEAFNLLNHASLGEPNPVVFSGTNISSSAGVITRTTTPSRQIQFALKLLF